MRKILLCLTTLLVISFNSEAARLKDIAAVKGVRENILIGYGIVVGLKGSGDSSADVTSQSLGRLFSKLGLEVKDSSVKSKNAAAVIVTGKLPPFARVGNKIDVTVSSIGDASSLEGGILLVTPLRGGDQNPYAVAQGPVSIGALANGEGGTFPTVGRVVSGATAARVVTLINAQLGGKFSTARDSGTIDVVVPFSYEGKSVELLATLENIQVNIDQRAKVVINERTGTVVMGGSVSISSVGISHGDLSIEVKSKEKKGEEGAELKKENIAFLKQGTSVSDLVRALNALGVKPKDLTAIFQSLRKVGALQADLTIM
jgi:flagellar P-ring protein FlgI